MIFSPKQYRHLSFIIEIEKVFLTESKITLLYTSIIFFNYIRIF